jgi:hypothetical protein
MRTFSKIQIALFAVGTLGLLGSMTVLATSSMSSSSMLPSKSMLRQAPPAPEPLGDNELRTLLDQIALTSENLAAAGFSSQEVSALVARAGEYLKGSLTEWRAAQRSLEDAQANLIKARQPDMTDQTAQPGRPVKPTQTQMAALKTAQEAWVSKLDAARSFILSQTDASKVASLNNLKANARREVPLQYRVVERTDAQWVQLRDALSSLRLSAKWQSPEDSAARSTVVDADAQASVVAAKVNLDARKAEVQQALKNAVTDAVKP